MDRTTVLGHHRTVLGRTHPPSIEGVRPVVLRQDKRENKQVVVSSPMSEDDLLAGVLDLLRVLGFRTLHIRPGRIAHGWRTSVSGDGVGFVDVLAVKPGRILAIELKSSIGRVHPAQQEWLDALAAAGAETFVFRPADYPDRIAQAIA